MIEQASDLENPEDVVFCFRMGRTEMGMLEESNDPGSKKRPNCTD